MYYQVFFSLKKIREDKTGDFTFSTSAWLLPVTRIACIILRSFLQACRCDFFHQFPFNHPLCQLSLWMAGAILEEEFLLLSHSGCRFQDGVCCDTHLHHLNPPRKQLSFLRHITATYMFIS